MALFRHSDWDRAYLYQPATTTTDSSSSNFLFANSNKPSLSFEERIARLLDSFLAHLGTLKQAGGGVAMSGLLLAGEGRRRAGEGEAGGDGQCLLHLCASLCLGNLIEKLSEVKKVVACMDRQVLSGGQDIEDELDPFNLDANGDTAVVT